MIRKKKRFLGLNEDSIQIGSRTPEKVEKLRKSRKLNGPASGDKQRAESGFLVDLQGAGNSDHRGGED